MSIYTLLASGFILGALFHFILILSIARSSRLLRVGPMVLILGEAVVEWLLCAWLAVQLLLAPHLPNPLDATAQCVVTAALYTTLILASLFHLVTLTYVRARLILGAFSNVGDKPRRKRRHQGAKFPPRQAKKAIAIAWLCGQSFLTVSSPNDVGLFLILD